MTVNGGDAERSPQFEGSKELARVPAEPPEGEPNTTEEGEQPKRSVNKLRIAGYALLVVAVLAALVPIFGLASDPPATPASSADAKQAAAERTTTSKPATKSAEKAQASKSAEKKKASASASKKAPKSSVESAELGPVIDAETTERAEAGEARRKLVVGGVAVGLLLIVLWGRRVRSAKSKS